MSGRRVQIELQPTVLRWARERASLDVQALASRVKVSPNRVVDWEESGQISIAQAERLASCTHTPVGYLYLREPPEDRLPIADFRTAVGQTPERPSPDLLETVDIMARRQTWMRENLIEDGADPLPFVGCCGTDSTPIETAGAMWKHLGLATDWALTRRSWSEALTHLRNRVEASGILVAFNGFVGSDTHRKLDRTEFQGFALVDPYAPLVFINSADFKATQMFTLAHETAHVFVGVTGVSNIAAMPLTDHGLESFCNRAAAEFLAPQKHLLAHWRPLETIADSLQAVAARLKVSMLVAAHKALHLGLIDESEFHQFYDTCRQQVDRKLGRTLGVDFWNSQKVRIGRRFGAAVSRAVAEDRLSYREAYSLTGLHGARFDSFVRSLEPAK